MQSLFTSWIKAGTIFVRRRWRRCGEGRFCPRNKFVTSWQRRMFRSVLDVMYLGIHNPLALIAHTSKRFFCHLSFSCEATRAVFLTATSTKSSIAISWTLNSYFTKKSYHTHLIHNKMCTICLHSLIHYDSHKNDHVGICSLSQYRLRPSWSAARQYIPMLSNHNHNLNLLGLSPWKRSRSWNDHGCHFF